MKTLNTLIMSAVAASALTITSIGAYAQDGPAYFLLEDSQVHPTKMKDYKAAWKTVLKHADKHDYKFPTFASTSGPRVSLATPLSSYGDIDAVMKDRDRVYEAGGREFEKAIDKLNAATFSDTTFVAKHMPDISNPPSDADMEDITIYEIGRARVQPGTSAKFSKIMAAYKKGLEEAGLSGSVKYNVYAGGIGTDGAYFFQSFAKNGVDMAEQDAKVDAMFEADEDMQNLFDDYLALVRPGSYSATEKWKMADELSFMPDNE